MSALIPAASCDPLPQVSKTLRKAECICGLREGVSTHDRDLLRESINQVRPPGACCYNTTTLNHTRPHISASTPPPSPHTGPATTTNATTSPLRCTAAQVDKLQLKKKVSVWVDAARSMLDHLEGADAVVEAKLIEQAATLLPIDCPPGRFPPPGR